MIYKTLSEMTIEDREKLVKVIRTGAKLRNDIREDASNASYIFMGKDRSPIITPIFL